MCALSQASHAEAAAKRGNDRFAVERRACRLERCPLLGEDPADLVRDPAHLLWAGGRDGRQHHLAHAPGVIKGVGKGKG